VAHISKKSNFNRSLSSACSLALTNSSARFSFSFHFERQVLLAIINSQARFSFSSFLKKISSALAMINSAAVFFSVS
jgi:hypothetical protein